MNHRKQDHDEERQLFSGFDPDALLEESKSSGDLCDSDDFVLFPDILEDTRARSSFSTRSSSTSKGSSSSGITSDSDFQLPVDMQSVDALLSKEMADLSMHERETIQKDIYGVAPLLEETEKSVSEGLARFEKQISAQEKLAMGSPSSSLAGTMAAYLRAKEIDPTTVTDRKLRLAFLRASAWDYEEAEKRLFGFFSNKLDLFGEAMLTREVVWGDLNEREQALVRSGYMTWLQERDAAGRRVMVMIPAAIHLTESKLSDTTMDHDMVIRSRLRAWFYIIKDLLYDEVSHVRGFVCVALQFGDLSILKDYKYFQSLHARKYGGPVRIAGAHFCYHNPFIRPFITFNRLIMGKEVRARFVPHYSDDMDQIIHELQTYGIQTQSMPKLIFDKDTGDMSLSLEHHQEFVERMVERDMQDTPEGIILVPQRFDVLFGRDNAAVRHTGNLRCQHIVLMQYQKYEAASKFGKADISERVVSLINEAGGRFLKPVNGGWTEVERDVAKNKIAHFFRKLRTLKNKEEKARGSAPQPVRLRDDNIRKSSDEKNCEKRPRV